MSDDIVERLRRCNEIKRRGEDPGVLFAAIDADAADEIERLRKALADERERCAGVVENLAKFDNHITQVCCGVGAYSAGGGPPECCAEPLLKVDIGFAAAAIRKGE